MFGVKTSGNANAAANAENSLFRLLWPRVYEYSHKLLLQTHKVSSRCTADNYELIGVQYGYHLQAWPPSTLNVITESRSFPPLLSISIDDAAEGLQAGRFTSVELVKAYLARIEEASEFRAVLQVNSDVLQAAQSLDEERQRSTSRGCATRLVPFY